MSTDPNWKPYKGLPVFKIRRIQEAYPVFKDVQKATNVPWWALAAVWMRETGRFKYTGNSGGPFQFDPPPSSEARRSMLAEYTDLPDEKINEIVGKGVMDFKAAAMLAAAFLQHKMGGTITLDSGDDEIKEAFWRYNGTAYGGPEYSPYVMNFYSSSHKEMRIVGTIEGKPVNVIDQNPGAYTMYCQLRQLFPMNPADRANTQPDTKPLILEAKEVLSALNQNIESLNRILDDLN